MDNSIRSALGSLLKTAKVGKTVDQLLLIKVEAPALELVKPIKKRTPDEIIRSTAVGKVAKSLGISKSLCGSAIHYDSRVSQQFKSILKVLGGTK